MADKEVGGLTAATTLDGSELLHVVQGSNSRKTTVSAILGTAHSQAWSGVTGTPTTVSGYGITDAQAKNVNLTAIAALSPTSKSVIIGNGSAWTAESGATFRSSVGLAIGSDVQAYDADLTALGGLAKADGNVIIGNGTTWTVESGATLRTSFGLSIGSDVQAYNATLASLSGLTLTDGDLLYSTGASALANLAKGADGQVLRLSGGMPSWANVTGTGDMAAAIYDPNSVGGDAFSQDNMVDGTTNKNFTAAEKTKLAGAGDMLAANDLSDLASADTALTNLGAGAAGKVIFADADGQDTLDQIIDKDFTASITGATGVALSKLLDQNPSILMLDPSIVSDGSTDQTSKIVAAIGALDTAGYRGPLSIPYNTKFILKTVYDAVNAAVGLVLQDDSTINWHYTSSYKNKAIRVTYTGDLVDDDSFEMWASGHHPAIYLNNFGTAGTTSGDRRYSTILHGAGVDPFGDYITGLYTQAGGDGSGYWRWGVFQSSPFDIATKVTEWFAATAYAVGAIVAVRATGYVYECTVAGTSSSTAPSHTSGTATDGTVTWKYRQATIDGGGNTVFQVGQNANLTQQSAVVGSHSIDDMIMIHPAISGGAGYQYHVIQDETAQCTTLKVPTTGALNLGSAAKASATAAGVTVYPTGSGGSNTVIISNSGGGSALQLFETSGANTSLIRASSNGTLAASLVIASGVGTWTNGSDYRIKNIKGEVSGDTAIALLRQFRPKDYALKSHPDIVRHGYIAHEMQAAIPYAVYGDKDAVDENGEAIIQTIDPKAPIPLLHAALLNAMDRIDALEARLTALEAA